MNKTMILLRGILNKDYKSIQVFQSIKSGELFSIKYIISSTFDNEFKIECLDRNGNTHDINDCIVFIEYWRNEDHGKNYLLQKDDITDLIIELSNSFNNQFQVLFSSNYGKPDCMKDLNITKYNM